MKERASDIEVKNDGETTIYEVGFHIASNISEESVPSHVSAITDIIASHGGTIISQDFPKLIDLAYTISKSKEGKHSKFDKAYFGWIKFEMEPSKLDSFQKALALLDAVIRFLVIKTVRENTLVGSQIALGDRMHGKTSKDEVTTSAEAPKAPISEEELDKSIEQLVV